MATHVEGTGLWLTFGLLGALSGAGAAKRSRGSRGTQAGAGSLWNDLDRLSDEIALAVRMGDLDALARIEPDLDELLDRARSMGLRRQALERIERLVV